MGRHILKTGAEIDLDLRHYERFIDQNLTRDNNVPPRSTGQSSRASARGRYRGQAVQVIPISPWDQGADQKIAQSNDIVW